MEVVLSIVGGSCGAAIVSGTVALIQFLISRRDSRSGRADAQNKALRYLMLYIIQERAKQHIFDGCISLDDRRSLHHWHDLYHNGLGGNGDADALMRQVDSLPLDTDAF
jgi:hypothetical protein